LLTVSWPMLNRPLGLLAAAELPCVCASIWAGSGPAERRSGLLELVVTKENQRLVEVRLIDALGVDRGRNPAGHPDHRPRRPSVQPHNKAE
jgi:hypothetical protein